MANPYRDRIGRFASAGGGKAGGGKAGGGKSASRPKRASMGPTNLSQVGKRTPKADRKLAAQADRAATKKYAKIDKLFLKEKGYSKYGAAIKAARPKGTIGRN